MKNKLGIALGLLAVTAFATKASAQIECVEECWHICLGPPWGCIGYGCIQGGQGDNCQAGSYYCMIDLCGQDPWGFVGPDGRHLYASMPCEGGEPLLVSHLAIEVESSDVGLLWPDRGTDSPVGADPPPPATSTSKETLRN